MRLAACSSMGLLLSFLVAGSAASEQPSSAAADPGLQAFLAQFEEATTRFINGDAAPWKRHASHRDDATIMGAWGAYEKGWDEVGRRYDAVAARIADSGTKVRIEYLSGGVSGDLAYTVTIERSELRLAGQDKPAPSAQRVTQIFRKEDGEWKLLHRHADPLLEKQLQGKPPEK